MTPDKDPAIRPRARVLLLDMGLEFCGGQRQVLFLAEALARSGMYAPLLAAPRSSPLLREGAARGLDLFPLPGQLYWNPLNYWRLARFIRQERLPVILHTHDAKAASLGALAARRNPAVMLVHTRRRPRQIKTGVRGRKYRDAVAVAAVSAEVRQALIQGGVVPDRIGVIPSAIDPAAYVRHAPRNDGRFIFIAAGKLDREKGFETLIKALPHLAAQEDLPPWELRILGEGPLFQPLLELAESLAVAGFIALLGKQDSRALLPGADILVAPSLDGEENSAAIKEAWAVGLPVVVSDLPANLELIKSGENGLSFPAENPEALAVQMATLMRSPVLRASLVSGGDVSVKKVNVSRMASAYMRLYGKILRVHGGGPDAAGRNT